MADRGRAGGQRGGGQGRGNQGRGSGNNYNGFAGFNNFVVGGPSGSAGQDRGQQQGGGGNGYRQGDGFVNPRLNQFNGGGQAVSNPLLCIDMGQCMDHRMGSAHQSTTMDTGAGLQRRKALQPGGHPSWIRQTATARRRQQPYLLVSVLPQFPISYFPNWYICACNPVFSSR